MSVNESFTQSFTPGIRTNFRVAPNVSFNYRYSVSRNNQGSNETIFYTNAPSIDFDAYIWESLTLRSDYTYTEQRRKGETGDSFQTWNASLSYRKNRDAKWEYEVKATNLLDIDARLSNNANNFFVASNQTFIQPRFITLRVIYTL